jgi:hemerythrin-like metal-binding protein
VTNLLHNASKFTNAGGHVRVSVESRGARAHIAVRDDGVGVAAHLLPRLFEPFVQGESTIHRTLGGLGLGLSLVRGIAELHGGTVRAHSEGLGKGSEFVVTLPTTAPAVALAGVVAPTTGPSKRRVLVVEDSNDSAQSLRDLLEAIGGHEVHVASDGVAGVDAARQHPPDVVLCDLGLPEIDGFEVARRIRAATGAERDCRLVALSGYAAPDDIERSLRAGFDYHVAKPPDVDGLLKLVAEAPGRGTPTGLSEELATGHHEVDSQHAAMFAEAERLRRGGPDILWDSLQFLQHHATSHFAYEEALMDDVRYPRAALHQEQHLAFATELLKHRERLQRSGATPENVAALADAVESWIAEHVLDEDRKLAEFIRGRGTAVA